MEQFDPGGECRVILVWSINHVFISGHIPVLDVTIVSLIIKVSATVGILSWFLGLPLWPSAVILTFPSLPTVVLLSITVLPPLVVCLANSGH